MCIHAWGACSITPPTWPATGVCLGYSASICHPVPPEARGGSQAMTVTGATSGNIAFTAWK